MAQKMRELDIEAEADIALEYLDEFTWIEEYGPALIAECRSLRSALFLATETEDI